MLTALLVPPRLAVLALVELATAGVVADAATESPTGPRWEPQWLEILIVVAIFLVTLAVVWWLFLVVRVQDRWRHESIGRRRRR